jgi:hypothetical protein
MRKPMPVSELVDRGMRNAIEVGDCLEWQGQFSCRGATPCVKSRDGSTYSAAHAVNRHLWERAHGPVPEGKIVYRKCCNNACVNIDHLAVGTKAQWVANRKKHGLTKHTLAHKIKIAKSSRVRPTARNSVEQVKQVRELSGHLSKTEISVQTGVSLDMVCDILAGRAWRDYSSPFAGLGA